MVGSKLDAMVRAHRPLGRGVHLDRTDRLCLMCKSLHCVEDEQHFVFDCPAYSRTKSRHLDLLQHYCNIADFMSLCKPNACGGLLRNASHVGSKCGLYEFTKLNLLSVRFQLPPRTLHTLIDWLIEHPHTALGLTLGQRNA